MTGADPVLAVDVMSHLLHFFVTARHCTRPRPPFHLDGGGEKAVDHHVGVPPDGRGEVCVAVQSQTYETERVSDMDT